MPTVSEFVNVVNTLDMFWAVKYNYDGSNICGCNFADEDIDAFLEEYGDYEVVNARQDFGTAIAYI